jgi:hypothetical protein
MSNRPPTSLKTRTSAAADAARYLRTISTVPMGRGMVEYAPPLARAEVLDIASGIVNVSLTSDQMGRYYLQCPGISMHSGGKGARRDCEFMPDGAPTLRCFHESCGAALDELNRSIRSACGKAKVRKFTDSTARATQAAKALLIGFDMAEADARVILNEWGSGCTPPISSGDILSGLKSAQVAYNRSPESVGCMLDGGSMPSAPSSPRPPRGDQVSVMSGVAAMSKPAASQGVRREEPIYIGAIGALAKAARQIAADYEDNHGRRAITFLVGTAHVGAFPARLAGMPAERHDHQEHSVIG